jgi:hypothetical protein
MPIPDKDAIVTCEARRSSEHGIDKAKGSEFPSRQLYPLKCIPINSKPNCRLL